MRSKPFISRGIVAIATPCPIGPGTLHLHTGRSLSETGPCQAPAPSDWLPGPPPATTTQPTSHWHEPDQREPMHATVGEHLRGPGIRLEGCRRPSNLAIAPPGSRPDRPHVPRFHLVSDGRRAVAYAADLEQAAALEHCCRTGNPTPSVSGAGRVLSRSDSAAGNRMSSAPVTQYNAMANCGGCVGREQCLWPYVAGCQLAGTAFSWRHGASWWRRAMPQSCEPATSGGTRDEFGRWLSDALPVF